MNYFNVVIVGEDKDNVDSFCSLLKQYEYHSPESFPEMNTMEPNLSLNNIEEFEITANLREKEYTLNIMPIDESQLNPFITRQLNHSTSSNTTETINTHADLFVFLFDHTQSSSLSTILNNYLPIISTRIPSACSSLIGWDSSQKSCRSNTTSPRPKSSSPSSSLESHSHQSSHLKQLCVSDSESSSGFSPSSCPSSHLTERLDGTDQVSSNQVSQSLDRHHYISEAVHSSLAPPKRKRKLSLRKHSSKKDDHSNSKSNSSPLALIHLYQKCITSQIGYIDHRALSSVSSFVDELLIQCFEPSILGDPQSIDDLITEQTKMTPKYRSKFSGITRVFKPFGKFSHSLHH
eukprot:gb/GECH01014069.1/.p1 GENE.gb/GECH01014069.1/~~gb/GECH01014069.1/.p1  ORF type:complete len:348 (+),score=115.19 gb/GECH01014069.1/:1-1044(+)